jgi:hypothetical protein
MTSGRLFIYTKVNIMGMLKKAREWRKGRTSFPMQDVEAVPEEDRRELLLQIEKVVAGNKIKVSPELFVINARKRGILLPFLVTGLAITVLISGLFGLYTLFRREERNIGSTPVVSASVEGRLIDEIRKEAEALVAEKDQEIDEIERRLLEIEEQRNTLQSSMESRIALKEEELRRELEAELEELRQKLLAGGASEAVIAEELKNLEEERTAYYEQLLAEFKNTAMAERRQAEENLRRMEREAEDTLRRINEERDQLRLELENKLAGSLEGLEAAQLELAKLTDLRTREENVSSQILGLYLSLKENISEGAIARGEQNLSQLRALLNNEAYLSITSFREQKSANLFILESLERMLDEEKQKLSAAEETPPTEAEAEEAARRLLDEAAAYTEEGNYIQAVSTYLNLMVRYPGSEHIAQVPKGITSILTSYDEELTELQQEAARISALAEERSGLISSLEERRRALELQLAELETRDPEVPIPESVLKEEIQELRDIEATISGLQQQYENYLRSVDQEALTRGDEEHLLNSKQSFDAFLLSPEAREIMPGLLEKIRIYDRAFERAGRRTALMETLEVVSELSLLSTPTERRAYLEKERASLQEEEMLDFIDELFYLID